MYSAVNPASRPKIRNTPIRSCEPSVVRCRLRTSFARVIADEKPMQYSVPLTSLSIVLGIATSGRPRAWSTDENDSVSSPPMVTRWVRPRCSMVSSTWSVRSKTPSAVSLPASDALSIQAGSAAARILRGFVREEWRIVPPVRSIVRVLLRSRIRTYSGSRSGPRRWWVSPSQPRRMPMTS